LDNEPKLIKARILQLETGLRELENNDNNAIQMSIFLLFKIKKIEVYDRKYHPMSARGSAKPYI